MMRPLYCIFIFSLAVLLPRSPLTADIVPTGSVSILAEPSLTVPLTLLAREYSRQRGVPVTLSFASGPEHIEQIGEGAEANVFITAKPAWIRTLQQQGQIDVYSRTPVARNHMALIAPPEGRIGKLSGGNLASLLPVNSEGFQFAVGDPQYMSEGTFAFQAMNEMKLTMDVGPHISVFPSAGELIAAMLYHGAYGMIYATDAALNPSLVRIAEWPDSPSSPIVYQAVVIVGQNMDEGRAFVAWLGSDASRSIFSRYGFEPVSIGTTENPI